jgi:hypothetical protein
MSSMRQPDSSSLQPVVLFATAAASVVRLPAGGPRMPSTDTSTTAHCPSATRLLYLRKLILRLSRRGDCTHSSAFICKCSINRCSDPQCQLNDQENIDVRNARNIHGCEPNTHQRYIENTKTKKVQGKRN